MSASVFNYRALNAAAVRVTGKKFCGHCRRDKPADTWANNRCAECYAKAVAFKAARR